MNDKTASAGDSLSDDELAKLAHKAQNGDEESLERVLIELSGMVRAVSRAYYLAGGEHDDVIQEGMIGLFMAVMNYDINKGRSFSRFAKVCVHNRIASAVKSASRKKHSPLNFYISVGPDMTWDERTDELSQAFPHIAFFQNHAFSSPLKDFAVSRTSFHAFLFRRSSMSSASVMRFRSSATSLFFLPASFSYALVSSSGRI